MHGLWHLWRLRRGDRLVPRSAACRNRRARNDETAAGRSGRCRRRCRLGAGRPGSSQMPFAFLYRPFPASVLPLCLPECGGQWSCCLLMSGRRSKRWVATERRRLRTMWRESRPTFPRVVPKTWRRLPSSLCSADPQSREALMSAATCQLGPKIPRPGRPASVDPGPPLAGGTLRREARPGSRYCTLLSAPAEVVAAINAVGLVGGRRAAPVIGVVKVPRPVTAAGYIDFRDDFA